MSFNMNSDPYIFRPKANTTPAAGYDAFGIHNEGQNHFRGLGGDYLTGPPETEQPLNSSQIRPFFSPITAAGPHCAPQPHQRNPMAAQPAGPPAYNQYTHHAHDHYSAAMEEQAAQAGNSVLSRGFYGLPVNPNAYYGQHAEPLHNQVPPPMSPLPARRRQDLLQPLQPHPSPRAAPPTPSRLGGFNPRGFNPRGFNPRVALPAAPEQRQQQSYSLAPASPAQRSPASSSTAPRSAAPTLRSSAPTPALRQATPAAPGGSQKSSSRPSLPKPTDGAAGRSSGRRSGGEQRVLSGSVGRVCAWARLSDKAPLLLEVFGPVIGVNRITKGRAVLRLQDGDGPVLECTFYEMDRPMAPMRVGMIARCVGRATGRGRLQAFSVRVAPAEESGAAQRLNFVSHQKAQALADAATAAATAAADAPAASTARR